ncbi:MAG: hypothetical protein O2985_07045 [Proteobacteria bacterium]|nr:hypothetical protein [Pseudomonadota bacterium]
MAANVVITARADQSAVMPKTDESALRKRTNEAGYIGKSVRRGRIVYSFLFQFRPESHTHATPMNAKNPAPKTNKRGILTASKKRKYKDHKPPAENIIPTTMDRYFLILIFYIDY